MDYWKEITRNYYLKLYFQNFTKEPERGRHWGKYIIKFASLPQLIFDACKPGL